MNENVDNKGEWTFPCPYCCHTAGKAKRHDNEFVCEVCGERWDIETEDDVVLNLE